MTEEITQWSIIETRRRLAKKEINAIELVETYLKRINSLNPSLNAFITVCEELALKEARYYVDHPDKLVEKPLGGVPIAIKDCLCTEGIRTTCGSKILESFVPPYNATVVEKLLQAGAIIIGKTNMDEFAMGSSTEHSYFGPARNPWDTSRVPGGSSGGSAVAVAACLCPGAIGTDTGGSIRQPAAFCGIVGMKPTYGRVSRYGLIAFASSLDQAGPMARNVQDTALLLQVISGYDPKDTTSILKEVPPYCEEMKKPVRNLRLGIPKEYFAKGIDSSIEEAIRQALRVYENLGARIVDISLPHTEYGVAAYYIIAPAEASSNLARYDGVKYGFRAEIPSPDLIHMYLETRSRGFGSEVKRRIMLGTYALSSGYYDAYYHKASQVRNLIRKDFEEAFLTCDAIIAPVTPVAPFLIGEKLDDPLSMYLSDVYTLPASLAGIPGVSVPCGFSPEGLPIGMQILGNYFQEDLLLRLAYIFEQETGLSPKYPSI
ncbi:MAG: Asp-tRNA(Asn)/Glu-tRNA(Gln) amidotransferase subunit GatA [Syntrophobacterales bacterium]|nr:Asp-tRNA(Asn)/Glu-tRNA(Gln) amidotransferase subunit GatA [Syntrophobacterales bacterium]